MTEEQYIVNLKLLGPMAQERETSLQAIELADEAVQAYPASAKLWCIRGDYIQLGPENCPHDLQEALLSYQRAVQVEPNCADAYDSIAYFLDAVENKPEEAKHYFKKAASCRRNSKVE